MVFIFGTEVGPWYNPFQVTEGAGVPMQTITIKENGVEKKVRVPVGPDKGFSAVIKADGTGARKKALYVLDSAPVFGAAWIFPNYVWNPRMAADKIPEIFRKRNDGLFKGADNFKSESGVTDMISVAAGYTVMSLRKLGLEVPYTRQFTTLLRALAEHDLGLLRNPKPPTGKAAEDSFVKMVEERYGNRYAELNFDSKQQMLDVARNLYRVTRLSTIGDLVLGGGR
jgi:hypothetical protein